MSYAPPRHSLAPRPVSPWFRDAKLGIFVHWGPYSVPAFAAPGTADYTSFMRDLTTGATTADRIPYAEWYLNSMRVPGSPTAMHHAATYGADFGYTDFQPRFDAAARAVDVADWADLFTEAGARYVVLVARHLDGYPLWPTAIGNPHMPSDYRCSRDLVGELSVAVRQRGLRMGLYYCGGMNWTFRTTPLRTMTDLIRHQALGPGYARYATAQWRELIDTYAPSILWNDMGWPAQVDPHEIMAHYYDTVPDGVVNDRWMRPKLPGNRFARAAYLRFLELALRAMGALGRPIPDPPKDFHYDFATHEYAVPTAAPSGAWELTRGLGRSFGYNAAETAADTLTGVQAIHLLVDVVAAGGNLLLNVGPDGEGRIPELQREPLRALGTWLGRNAEAIYDTVAGDRTATTTTDGHAVRFTRRGDTVHAIVLADQPVGPITLRELTIPDSATVGLVGGPPALTWKRREGDLLVELPAGAAPQPHAFTLAITGW
ncbi:alpha-L-fucosidase [Nocardia sp. NPDC087230]|uniref:alpha-L-fucosidase n=1 Tax=Nocardia sp. NPDC087230 TaxID=3364331 RepID=UPI003806EBAD